VFVDVWDANRQSVSSGDGSGGGAQYDKTLADYLKFDSEMCVVGAVWKDCKRLIEAYNEQQVSGASTTANPAAL